MLNTLKHIINKCGDCNTSGILLHLHLFAGPNRAAAVAVEVSQSKSSHPGQEKYHSDYDSNPRGARAASFLRQHLFSMTLETIHVKLWEREEKNQRQSLKMNMLMTSAQQASLCEDHNEHWWVIEEMLYHDSFHQCHISHTRFRLTNKNTKKQKETLALFEKTVILWRGESTTETELAPSCRTNYCVVHWMEAVTLCWLRHWKCVNVWIDAEERERMHLLCVCVWSCHSSVRCVKTSYFKALSALMSHPRNTAFLLCN